jgi:hypothetical protein
MMRVRWMIRIGIQDKRNFCNYNFFLLDFVDIERKA